MKPDDIPLRLVTLEDKYRLERGPVYLSGTQALIRVLLEQRRRDVRAGLNTAGFVSGYRGSPLGGVDLGLWQAGKLLPEHHIHFEPGLNEELAATMVQGSQQVAVMGGAKYDGVFGMWYAKNPGVDRAGDALKHGNAAGTAKLGGVLAVSGDDPGATSSSIPNQCEHAFMSASIPILAPASVAEILEYGLLGFAMSRYAGVWVGFKTVADVVESTVSVTVDPEHPSILLPTDFDLSAGPMGIRWPESRWEQDNRLLGVRIPAVQAFARANRFDRIVFGSARPRFGIVTSGKATMDVRQALEDLGIDQSVAEALGLAVYKAGMVWPLEPQHMREFAEGLDEVLVIEERRAFIETQLKEQAYNWPSGKRPLITGKTDESGAPLLPEGGELDSGIVARAIGRRLARRGLPEEQARRLAGVEARLDTAKPAGTDVIRVPHFCAGCPHARSTQVPEGSLAMAGIGCHSLRLWMPNSNTMFMVQMGGEGSNWLGAAPFVETGHVFQNLGDGTYTHSGSLGVRAAVAAKRSVTFRILYNSAVAMTGGQPAEGALTVGQISQQLLGEGVKRVAVVAEEPKRHDGSTDLASGVEVYDRNQMDKVQREFRDIPGVTAIIYDQMCATEKRRHRKRGDMTATPERAFINERVCEGCGDCVQKSQCAAVMPVDTPLGRKRTIDQSACNADLSCVEGFCPSFVTIEGGKLRRVATQEAAAVDMPYPRVPVLDSAFDIIVNGIGGTGVITVGAILGMAAHLEGRGCSVLDNTGIARKGGAVSTHVRIAPRPADVHSTRVADRRARLVIGGDLVVTAEAASLSKIAPGVTHVILNSDAVPTLNQRLDPDGQFDDAPLARAVAAAAGDDGLETLHATAITERFMGDAIFANMLMLGYAWQKARVPLSLVSIDRAIELNGNSVEANRKAFALGRRTAHDPASVSRLLSPAGAQARRLPAEMSFMELVADRVLFLTDYQNAAYAKRYSEFVQRVREAEGRAGVAGERLARAVAQGYFRLLAIKDEYEVARLYSDGEFRKTLENRFEDGFKVRYNLAPPLLAKRDPRTGHLQKRKYGAWIGALFPVLAKMRVLRGSALDIFGYTEERRMERQLVVEYERVMVAALDRLSSASIADVIELAELPERMRGYGHVKEKNVRDAKLREKDLLAKIVRQNVALVSA